MDLILTVRLAGDTLDTISGIMVSVFVSFKAVESKVVRLVKAATFGTLPRGVVTEWRGGWVEWVVSRVRRE